jgi:hypothetical protein
MIKTIDELKDLILFAKDNKVKNLKVGTIELEISELAHIEQTSGLEMGQSVNKSVSASIGGFQDDGEQVDPEDEDLLFHSSRP